MGRPILHVSTMGWHGAMQCADGYEKRTYSRTSSIWLKKRRVGRQKGTAKKLGVLRNRWHRLKQKKTTKKIQTIFEITYNTLYIVLTYSKPSSQDLGLM